MSKEYLEETAYNSQPNIYFGYTLEELNGFFQGDRYIFNLSDEGTTTVEKLQEVADADSQQVIKNVATGTGVIFSLRYSISGQCRCTDSNDSSFCCIG